MTEESTIAPICSARTSPIRGARPDREIFPLAITRGRAVSKTFAQSEAMIPHDARSHGVAPTDVVDRHAKGISQSLTFVRAGCPAAVSDRFDPFRRQLRPFGDAFHRQTGFLEQQINGFHGKSRLLGPELRTFSLPSSQGRDYSSQGRDYSAMFPDVASPPR